MGVTNCLPIGVPHFSLHQDFTVSFHLVFDLIVLIEPFHMFLTASELILRLGFCVSLAITFPILSAVGFPHIVQLSVRTSLPPRVSESLISGGPLSSNVQSMTSPCRIRRV